MKTTTVLAAFSLTAFALLAHADDKPVPASTPAPATPIVAIKVDGDEIKKSEIDDDWKVLFQGHDAPSFDTFDPKMKDKFLREVAGEHLLYKQAQKEGFENSDEVKAEMEKIKHQVVIQAFLKDKTKADTGDDKLKAAYDAHLKASESESGNTDEFKARHILVKTKPEADAIEKKLKNGGDFEKIAKEQSQDKGSGASGGELGWFTADKMVPEFSAAAAKLKKGEISPPVKSDFGWHVIQLEDRRKATPPSFDEVKDTLKQEVGNKAVGKYIQSLMSGVKITEVDAGGKETVIPDAKDALTPAAGGGSVPTE